MRPPLSTFGAVGGKNYASQEEGGSERCSATFYCLPVVNCVEVSESEGVPVLPEMGNSFSKLSVKRRKKGSSGFADRL